LSDKINQLMTNKLIKFSTHRFSETKAIKTYNRMTLSTAEKKYIVLSWLPLKHDPLMTRMADI